MKKVIITEKQKKAIAAQDQVGGMVRQGLIPYGVCESPDYELGRESNMGYYHVTNGSAAPDGSINEIAPTDVDLSSFNIKKELNKDIWVDGKLNPEIRLNLMDIARDFCEFAGIDFDEIDDIILTGSIANYNWDKNFSDIDLHIVYNFADSGMDFDKAKEFFDLKRRAWNEQHSEITVKGFTVELYVQDPKEEHTSSGVYSVNRDEWITEPDRNVLSTSKVSKEYIKRKVSWYTEKIDTLERIYNERKDDKHRTEKVLEIAEKLFDMIKDERRTSLTGNGKEISNGNIIFKTLRRNGYLDKLSSLKKDCYNFIKSI